MVLIVDPYHKRMNNNRNLIRPIGEALMLLSKGREITIVFISKLV